MCCIGYEHKPLLIKHHNELNSFNFQQEEGLDTCMGELITGGNILFTGKWAINHGGAYKRAFCKRLFMVYHEIASHN